MRIGPQLDFYIGRSVSRIEQKDECYEVELFDNVCITIEEGELPQDLEIGYMYLRTIMSKNFTRMQFGIPPRQNAARTEMLPMEVKAEIQVDPLKYRIADPKFAMDKPFYPQASQEGDLGTPEDPSPLRIVDEGMVAPE